MTDPWNPINTAITDGSRLLGWFPDLGPQVMQWAADHWIIIGNWLPFFEPTHWMPLPSHLPYPADTAPKDGTMIVAEFEGVGVVVAQWTAPEGCVAGWNHGAWLPHADPLRWDDLPPAPRA